jgi:hypothetical protein
MEYDCGPLLLFSKDKIRMMDFLSDVLEFDVDSINDIIKRGPLSLKLCEYENLETTTHHDHATIAFSFKVKGEDELKEIMSKYNFFLYRKSAINHSVEKLDLVQNDENKILTISDIDQRLWQFECVSRPPLDV